MTTTTRSGTPTAYRSNSFRSRLEARWAAFFDLVGWSWVYEPFDTGGWIPDFLLTGATPFLVEVGPCLTTSDYRAKGQKARDAYPTSRKLVGTEDDGVYLEIPERWTVVLGVTPAFREPGWLSVAGGYWATLSLPEDPDYAAAFWTVCSKCSRLCFWPPTFDLPLQCGHHVDWTIDAGIPAISLSEIEDLWARAGSAVQWKP